MAAAKKNCKCPLCDGTGKVTAKVANSSISTRPDREKHLAQMREINKARRDAERAEKLKKKIGKIVRKVLA